MPPIDTSSFQGTPFPPDVLDAIWLKVLTGSPFAQAIQPLPTSSGSVAFPTAAPAGAAWTKELAPIPEVVMNDDADIVATCKLAGLVSLSNESLDDASIPIGELTGNAIRDSMGPTMDEGLLRGDGVAPNPDGVLAKATPAAAGADFRAAVIAAYGELAGVGAQVTSITCFAHPTVIAAEWSRTSTTGEPLHDDAPADALTIGPGIRVIGVPSLGEDPGGDVLVADTSALFLVQREAFTIELSREYGFANDSTALRVKARVAVAAPTPLKSLRLATIGAAARAKAA